ncbi:AAA family ATPase [Kocuria rosea subsp. polaris]|uniref:AAA family ATPase n=1 Tax=Kocuria rosea subsp. polaris TaxID=136273 RepID=A0A0W8IN58_KOCRO|nr:UvrD-helicase domain-containing protein [Kocuria polaris]KUG61203.1 AAA family ATPase [Kocuria polaris]
MAETVATMAAEQLAVERAYVAMLYDRLDELRAEKTAELAAVRRSESSGNHQNRAERDAFASHYEDRLAQLEAVDHRLVFGRLDGQDGERRYVGRIGLATADHQRLMVDWRAREAAAFYQATAQSPMGVRRRRHLILEGRDVAALEDDVLDPDMLGDEGVLHGEGALLAALNQKRTGRMSDIVATIQAEQDRIIRAPLPGVRVVQGGPGTGKTAVALHRAAYLLYEHRERLRKAGVLIVGPSSSFMWYIERVLPALGETGVVMSSLSELFPGVAAVPERDPLAARLKAGLDMADVVARAVRDRQKVPAQDQVLRVDTHRVTLTPRMVKRARDKARATGKPHNEARNTFVKIALRELTEQLGEHLNSTSGNVMDRSYLAEDIRQSRDVRIALNLAWMPMSPQTLVGQLFSKRHYLESAAPHLDVAQIEALLRPAGAPFTVADVPLLDEAAELLGDLDEAGVRRRAEADREHRKATDNAEHALQNMHQSLEDVGADGIVTAAQLTDFNAVSQHRMTAAEAATADRTWAYGHVVVDEAQELTPMQWRVLMRRCPMKSFTVVGDIAQAGSATAARSWRDALEPFVGERFVLDELTVNYRTPAAIAEAAVDVARAAGLDISAPRAVREGAAPIVQRVGAEDVVEGVLEQVRTELELVNGGLVAVIVPEDRVQEIGTALAGALPGLVGAGVRRLDRQVVVLSAWDAKGLEFDSVVVVEPQALVEEVGGGVGNLYVAMTRPTQRLRVVAARPLPAGLDRF